MREVLCKGAAAYTARMAAAIGNRAARNAGSNPPTVPIATAHSRIKIKAATPARTTNLLWNMRIWMVELPIIRLRSMNLA